MGPAWGSGGSTGRFGGDRRRAGVVCPVCESSGWRRALRADAFEIERCRRCGLGRTCPAPRESDGREHISDNEAYYRRFYVEQAEFRYALAEKTLEVVREFADSGKMLDVGCGMGFFVHRAVQEGYHCVGIDTSPAATRFARERLNLGVTTGDLLDDSFEVDECFDVVTMNHVLEHVSRPMPFLGKVWGALKAGGIVISASPNFSGLVPRVLGARWYGLQPSQHVWQFGRESYAAIFEKVGFRLEALRLGSLHYADGSGWKAKSIFWLARLSDMLGQGDNLTLVARKHVLGVSHE